MDAGPLPPPTPPTPPQHLDQIALLLQGGGALGAYQAVVYEALHEHGFEPDWVAGVSIGGINGAIIAGNRPENRLPRLRDFWSAITDRRTWPTLPIPDPWNGDDPRKLRNTWASTMALLFGQPGLFTPHWNPWFSLRGSPTATSFYDTAPLRETLLRLIDFQVLNDRRMRYAAGAVNVVSGNFYYFDNADTEILPEHVMASAALPPAFPMVQVGTDHYWDGGLVSNTPLQHLLEHLSCQSSLVFQVDLFSAQGPLPRDMHDVLARQKDIQYSSRTRLVTDYYLKRYAQDRRLKSLLDRMPEELLTDEDRALRDTLHQLPQTTILHLIYQQTAYEGQAKDYDFSATSMKEHWASGYRDTARTLRHGEWLGRSGEAGIKVHDVHRLERERG
ncbi:MAG: patatin-like phospholipase family protein [Rhodospirillales bacterium]|nr:patatin-like phospholipase family protein [Rhodospirillales bacterium]